MVEINTMVSVVIPTYNRADYISRAVDSVLTQTYKNVEIIVVDDGSTDNTHHILKHYMDKIHYIHQENSGVEAARNAGIRSSSGRWIAFLDSDDYWLPEKLRIQVDCIKKEKVRVCFTNIIYSNETAKNTYELCKKEYTLYEPLEVIKHNTFYVQTMVIEKSLLREVGKFDENLSVAGDTLMIFQIALQVPKFAFIEKQMTVIERAESRNGLMADDVKTRRRQAWEGPYIFFQLYNRCDPKNKKLVKWIRNGLSSYLFLKAQKFLSEENKWGARRFAMDSMYFGGNIFRKIKCLIIIIFPSIIKRRIKHKF